MPLLGGTSSLIPVSYYRSSTASNESLFLAQQWIRQCYESHAQCGSKSLSALPKRVLQIANTTIKLYESKGEKAKYTCLSHCWGTSAPTHMTTKDTVHHYSSGAGIPIDSIPQTFRDAIDFSRRLGIEFIWIDSLCIIQDDLQDWEEQASQMASIYKEAHLTLCATSAPDSSWGCYSSCTQNMKPFSLFIGGNASTATLPFYRNDFPLLTRAWCYQERLLSPRLLHFTRGELMWECAGASACECTSLEFLVTSAGSLSLSQVHDIARHWHDIVEEYVNLELTFHSDRLVALSGIAQEVLRLRPGGEVYLAGLWRTTLLEDLRW
ncbi:HET-domain-containing protein, partial [Thozetella sp. PMI_491]